MNDETIKTELATPPANAALTIFGVPLAQLRDCPVDVVERLRAMHQEDEREKAQRACAAAIVAFQAECPTIAHTREVRTGNGKKAYSYAPYETIMRTIRPLLSKHGLAPSYDQRIEDGVPVVTCTITHTETGGTKQATFACPVDQPNAMTNQAKQMASANSFAKRQALVMALDLVTSEEDDDAGATAAPAEKMSAEDADTLRDLLAEIEEVDAKAPKLITSYLFAKFGVRSFEDIDAARFDWCRRALEKKLQSLRDE